MTDFGNEITQENILLKNGADYAVSEAIFDKNGNNIDLSDKVVIAQVRQYCDGPVVKSFTFTNFQDPETLDWHYERFMSQDDIAEITFSQGVWDQFLRHADDFVEPMFEGKVKIKCNVTKPTV